MGASSHARAKSASKRVRGQRSLHQQDSPSSYVSSERRRTSVPRAADDTDDISSSDDSGSDTTYSVGRTGAVYVWPAIPSFEVADAMHMHMHMGKVVPVVISSTHHAPYTGKAAPGLIHLLFP